MIRNSTIANNSAPQGGGIINEGGTVTLSNCTVANNSANFGGGITNFFNLLNLQSTIVAKNTGTDPDVSGTLTSFGHNLIGDTTGSTGSDGGGQTFTGRGIVLVRGSQVSLQDFGKN